VDASSSSHTFDSSNIQWYSFHTHAQEKIFSSFFLKKNKKNKIIKREINKNNRMKREKKNFLENKIKYSNINKNSLLEDAF